MDAFQRWRALGHDMAAGDALPDKGHRLDGWVFGQRLAGGFAETVDDVQNAGRQPSFQRDLRQQAGGQRAPFGRLVDDRAAEAKAGAIFQVDNMKGVFQGVYDAPRDRSAGASCSSHDAAVGRDTPSAAPGARSAKNRKFSAPRNAALLM